MSLRSRFRRLAVEARRQGFGGTSGCPACRDRRGRTVFITSREQLAGTVAPGPEALPPCAACGQVPEMVIEVVEVVVDKEHPAERGQDRG